MIVEDAENALSFLISSILGRVRSSQASQDRENLHRTRGGPHCRQQSWVRRHLTKCPGEVRSVAHLRFVSFYRPFNNPTETYRYYSLPFCQTHHEDEEEDRKLAQRKGANPHKQRLGESMVGDRRETSPYALTFFDNIEWRLLCKTSLSPADLKKLKNAIHEYYFFEMFVEDLPMWGYVGDFSDEDFIIGEVPGSRTYLFTHLHFTIGHNNGQIVSAKVNTDVRSSATA